MVKIGIGQDSHKFEPALSKKPLFLGGVLIPDSPGLSGNSDADVILHALINAISGVSCINILGKISDKLCLEDGITDSKFYLIKALETLKDFHISHISISVECSRPKLENFLGKIRISLSKLISVKPDHIGITATSGEGLTAFGRGQGIQAFVILTAEKE
ncbi:MAG: 2-C-methyl-D-erythritol 2,4-cyclodiphosphate synthase [Chitinispirillia bacterium]|jgi:2-C-methyl-D-erythritol 2,4-cyclodiphosphate synthase